MGYVVATLALTLAVSIAEAARSPEEAAAITERLRNFYRVPADPAVMSTIPSKHTAAGAPTMPSSRGRSKWLPEVRRRYCETFLRRHFPGLDCRTAPLRWAEAEPGDRLRDIAETWFTEQELRWTLDDIPTAGKVSTPYWSGDYWRMQWGLTSYRYSSKVQFKDYKSAIASYRQPEEWKGVVSELGGNLAKLAERLVPWSPSEKYDLTVGDVAFTLTNEQKAEGEEVMEPNGKVADWQGLCDGWAPAAVFVPPPVRAVTATGPGGVDVTWYPHDIQALLSLAWVNGEYQSSFAGGRCWTEKPATFPNGRLKQPECFDVNPATWHLAAGNFLGRAGRPLIMDVAFDHEVWNQPVVSYELEYFNPLDPDTRSAKWQEVAVEYDDTFKAQDRFQKPLTRGKRHRRNRYEDRAVKQVVGVVATIHYLDEIDAVHAAEGSPASETKRVTYTYDLELSLRHGKLIPTGGEWHENAHPDFLWLPHRDSAPSLRYDDIAVAFDLKKPASEALTKVAKEASAKDAYPLCAVLKPLADRATGVEAVHCR